MTNNLWPIFYMLIDFSSLNCFSSKFSHHCCYVNMTYHNSTETEACPENHIEYRLTWLSVWTKEIKAIYLYHIELHSHCIILHWIALCWIESHCIVIGVNHITLSRCVVGRQKDTGDAVQNALRLMNKLQTQAKWHRETTKHNREQTKTRGELRA